MVVNIAIDGTSASGKSSIASGVAKALGYLHLNTGSLYRAYALKLLNENVLNPTIDDVIKLINSTDVNVEFVNGAQVTLLDGKAVDNLLNDNKVSKIASHISPFIELREKVVLLQRKLASMYNIVIEGRDIGSVIIPSAKYKFFVTASDEVRATRRLAQLKENNIVATFEDVLQGIKDRDVIDSTREHSPLVKTEDAILIDTSNINLQQGIDLVLSYIDDSDKKRNWIFQTKKGNFKIVSFFAFLLCFY